MREWKEVTIDSICEKVTSGGTPLRKIKEYYNGNIPWVKTKQVDYNRIYDSEEYITELALKKTSVKLIPENSIIVAMYGDGKTAGRCAINKIPVTTNQACCNLIVNPFKADYNYVYYYLSTQYIKLVSLKLGGGQQNLNAKTLKEFKIPLPPLEIQHRIASILSAYDDLIENNLKRIKLLEELAQRTYEEWFVKFRVNGEALAIDEETGLPEGWERKEFQFFGEVITGKTPSTLNEAFFNGDIPFVKTPDMSGFPYVLKTGQTLSRLGANTQKKKIITKNSLMVSCIGSAGVYALASEDCQTNQQINSIKFYDESYSFYFYGLSKTLKPILEGIGSNGATMTNVNKGKFEKMTAIYPGLEILKEFHNNIKDNFSVILNLQKQNLLLKQSRDILLPRLMNGTISVEEAEENFAMAAEPKIEYQTQNSGHEL